jgi:Tol biopolymer transport system component
MPLSAGTRLGPYEIVAPLGAGGMGEVYRARDTRLDRTVAVKVLPTHLSANPEARQRFDREARSISSLSHPNICQLYDVGHQDGVDYLVMEFLEGETLAARITRGAVPTDQLLKIGSDVCDGLERAHRAGVVHRDLKPANIMLTKSGAKLMDFGLAKAIEAPATPAGSVTQTMGATPSSPITQAGVVVGTFQYMSPEQVEGKPADARTDIFSLGSVLYEMATGKRAFDGQTSASVIAGILEREPPPISAAQPASPAALDRIVKSCLAKDPAERWQTAHDVRLQLQSLREAGSQTAIAAVSPAAIEAERTRTNRNVAIPVLATMAISAIVFGLLGYMARRPQPTPAQNLQTALNLPRGLHLAPISVAFALSPDGTKLVFAAAKGDEPPQLWLRSLDKVSPQPLEGTDGATSPFWSPNSQAVGFFANAKLQKIDLNSSTVTSLADAPYGRGGTWNASGTILFAPTNIGGLFTVPEQGGTPKRITKGGAENGTDRLPTFLPDGLHAIFIHGAGGFYGGNVAMLVDIRNGDTRQLFDTDSQVLYANPGYVFFMRGRDLYAQPFDAGKFATTGDPYCLAQGVLAYNARRAGEFAVANSGLLIYQPDPGMPMRQLSWFDLATGKSLGTVGEPARFARYALSPDDQRVAAIVETTVDSSFKAPGAVWIYEVAKDTASRLTFSERPLYGLAWDESAKSVFYGELTERFKIYRQPVDGHTTATELPLDSSDDADLESVSPNGKWLGISRQQPRTFQIDLVPLTPELKGRTLFAPKADASGLTFSADGKWIAYSSNETGRTELYAGPVADIAVRWQISKQGVFQGGWMKTPGKILLVGEDLTVAIADVTEVGGSLQILKIAPTFGQKPVPAQGNGETKFNTNLSLNVTKDGKRILLAPMAETGATDTLNLVTDWRALMGKQ